LWEVFAKERAEGGETVYLVTMGAMIDILTWALNDGAGYLGPLPFGDLVKLMDDAEGSTPN
jgi:hypothetical protein